MEDLPPEANHLLKRLRLCIIALWVSGILLAAILATDCLSCLCLAAIGTLLLRDDPHLSKCYQILSSSPLPLCCPPGGLPMLAPFFICSLLSTIVDAFQLVKTFEHYGTRALCLIPYPILVITWVAELYATVLCAKVLMLVLPTMELQEDYQVLADDTILQISSFNRPPSSRSNSNSGHGPTSIPRSFVPFSGESHRLP